MWIDKVPQGVGVMQACVCSTPMPNLATSLLMTIDVMIIFGNVCAYDLFGNKVIDAIYLRQVQGLGYIYLKMNCHLMHFSELPHCSFFNELLPHVYLGLPPPACITSCLNPHLFSEQPPCTDSL